MDANILVSILNNELPLLTYTSRILSLADNKKFKVYTSPLCLVIAFYFAEKKSGSRLAKQKISLLNSKLNISSITGEIVTDALQNVSMEDFEDGMQYYSALDEGCKCIVTQDTADFHFANIEVCNAQQFVERYML